MTFLRTRRGATLLCAALVLVLFLFRPGAGRLKNRIANSIGQGLQRQVEIGSVNLRLLPRPGFDLEGFVVHDDPAFSAEPMLRAQEVTASLRLTALLRARLEVSRLSLTEPSLNLVRNEQGHWNIESILEHTAQTAVAPTGRNESLTRPEFPYIQADRGRINFKLGSEKKPFALADADYAFWQDSDSSWGMRLKASPIRTDFSLSDTGVLRASGTWLRAGRLRETPLQFTVLWEGAQLGQVTKLVSGVDRGWRGTVRTLTNLSGLPSELRIANDTSIEDFRRYDLPGGSPLRLSTHCEGHYSSVNRDLHDIACLSPVGDGTLALSGNVQRIQAPAAYSLTLTANAVPLAAALAVTRRAKKDLPADLQAAGSVTFTASLSQGDDQRRGPYLEGSGTTRGFKLQSASTRSSLVLGEVPLLFATEATSVESKRHGAKRPPSLEDAAEASLPRLVMGPFRMDPLSEVVLHGVVTTKGYSFAAAGDSDVKRLLMTARTLGLPAPPPVADGTARVDLRLAGDWKGFSAPHALGVAQLKESHVELRGLNGPVEIASAAIHLLPDRVDVQSISASLAGSHWKGAVSLPRGCPRMADCPIVFDLQADEIVPERLRQFADTSRPSPWYHVLASEPTPRPSLLSQLRASGKLKTAHLVFPNLTATHVASNVTVESGHLRLSALTADVLGGKHAGAWNVDFTEAPPAYTGGGEFNQVTLAELATSMHDPWLSGTGSGKYRVEARGRTLPELLATASGSLQFEILSGELNHIAVEGDPLKLRRFSGTLALKDGKFELQRSLLDSSSAAYAVKGTASWSRELNFTLVSDTAPSLTLTGTLASPKISAEPAAANRARLEH